MFYLVRHGQTDWNLAHKIQGPDVPLNENGKNDARVCGQKLASLKIERIISSDILRARQTAEIINEFLSVPVSYDVRLREACWGDLCGKAVEDITPEEWDTLKHDPHKIHAQSLAEFYCWAKDFFDKTDASQNTLLVTHEGGILMAKYLAENPPSFDQEAFEKLFWNVKVPNTKIYVWDKIHPLQTLPEIRINFAL